MPDKCDGCQLKEEFLNLATVVRNVLDGERRFTWSEKASYMMEVDKIIKRVNGTQENEDIQTVG